MDSDASAIENFDDSEKDIFEEVINRYLSVIDLQQDEIYNVRMMHHEVWRDVHQVPGISETRAGSRVERYTKILPVGSKSDVDYKLCVEDLLIETRGHGPLYFDSCSSQAYCKLFITEEGKGLIGGNKLLSKFFMHSFVTCMESGRSIITPVVFKMNVVAHCKFEMKETVGQRSPTSPAVSGEGALNPYDIVPCLRLMSWPSFIRKKVTEMYCFQASDGTPLPLFVVPTGNPLSQNRDYEWRISFAVLEIEIFKQLNANQRRLYGLTKYVFKVLLEKQELIKSYHLKILFLKWLENDDLIDSKPLSFLVSFFKHVLDAVEKRYIPHLFIEDCNIYPLYYHTNLKVNELRLRIDNENFESFVRCKIKEIISHDTNTNISDWECWLKRTNNVLKSRQQGGISETWISGYLTRLLSVIVYCLQKSQLQKRLNHAVENLLKLMQAHDNDKYIKRIIPHILCLLNEVYSIDVFSKLDDEVTMSCYRVSYFIHKAFYCYEKQDLDGVSKYLAVVECIDPSTDTIGVTVTKFQTGLDEPLDYVIKCNEKDLNSNRFYLCLNVIYLHMKIQLHLKILDKQLEGKRKEMNENCDDANRKGDSKLNKENDQTIDEIKNLVPKLVDAVEAASIREPYTGKLSYQHVGSLLLEGYQQEFSKSRLKWVRNIQPVFKADCTVFSKKELATNFDLR